MTSGHVYGDRFMKMLYRSDDGTEEEWVWNSRNGVTPFCIPSKDGTKEMTHVEWYRDQYLPDYKPQPGERYFAGPPEEPTLETAKEPNA